MRRNIHSIDIHFPLPGRTVRRKGNDGFALKNARARSITKAQSKLQQYQSVQTSQKVFQSICLINVSKQKVYIDYQTASPAAKENDKGKEGKQPSDSPFQKGESLNLLPLKKREPDFFLLSVNLSAPVERKGLRRA